MSIEVINDLSMQLVADDYSNGHSANQAGPTKTARALAIIHLAGHDAYAQITKEKMFPAQLKGLPAPPVNSGTDDAAGSVALIAAGCRAAEKLYPDFSDAIANALMAATSGADPDLLAYGVKVGDAWIQSRLGDGSDVDQEDTNYQTGPGHHQPDPSYTAQKTLGRAWGKVKPFVLASVKDDASLEAPPNLTSQEYAIAYDQVYDNGTVHLTERDVASRHIAAVGIFWGYDGSNLIGTPPRLYNQIVRAIPEVLRLEHKFRVRLLTAANVAMADGGIAAWYWKYEYDLWRPVVGIREADAGWGPTGQGDGNTFRLRPCDPFWRPLGAPRSNPFPEPMLGYKGVNFTPNFPAYPSGHATFGTACFETVALLLDTTPEQLTVTFISDEFNGDTTDNTGMTRPMWKQTFTLRKAIEDNKVSRIFLGVHWIFDAIGGEKVGKLIADKVAAEFKLKQDMLN